MLKKEVAAMVGEVFAEHKLPDEFARRVLEGIPELKFSKWECPFCGSITTCMQFLGEDVTYHFVMGVSGSAFKLLWARDWCPSNNSVGLLGLEVIRRVFWALGFEYEHMDGCRLPEDIEVFQRKIVEGIRNGKPVLAGGVVGPPDLGIVAGYEEGGRVLRGQSYFHDGSQGYYREADWATGCSGLILVGEKKVPPPEAEILRESLRWAIQLARTPHMVERRTTGLAAYDAWAAALGRDEDFPEGDRKVLTFRCNVHTSVTLSGLCDARRSAAAFLRSMADVDGAARPDLLAAADAYDEEVRILDEAMHAAPFCFSPEEERLKIADPALRAAQAEAVLTAKEIDARAVEHLERALASMDAA
jgi:hypothetical protein